MTLYILAYPNEEWKRLEKLVVALPIDADREMVDGKPERLPKQISRHLLPGREDRKSRKLVESAILDSSPPQSHSPPVEIHQIRASESSSNEEPVKIERDRQLYRAWPGKGKVLEKKHDSSTLHPLSRSNRHYINEEVLFPDEFNSPRVVGKWDRYQEAKAKVTKQINRSYESGA